jgi:hypothetical protein
MDLARLGHVNGERGNKRAGRLKSKLILRVGPERTGLTLAKQETACKPPFLFS